MRPSVMITTDKSYINFLFIYFSGYLDSFVKSSKTTATSKAYAETRSLLSIQVSPPCIWFKTKSCSSCALVNILRNIIVKNVKKVCFS